MHLNQVLDFLGSNALAVIVEATIGQPKLGRVQRFNCQMNPSLANLSAS